MSGKPKLLWVCEPSMPVPANVRQATRQAWELRPCSPDAGLARQFQSADIAVICPNGVAEDPRWLRQVLDHLDESPTVAVFLLPPEARSAWSLLAARRGRFLCLPTDAPAEELAAKLAAAAELQPAFRDLRNELAAARRTGSAVARQVEELDEEMRLAARLQRDFLPRRLPEVGPVRFGVLYRPASWVSGDIYDVVRLDETHVGFYVADAVGHGLPAALLTMFVKKALQTKRIVGHTYQIVPPHVSLAQLNADICEQNLSSAQFCSAVYCVLDAAGMELTFARAGHPEPLLVHDDGEAEVLTVPGSLLGVMPEEEYRSEQVRLRRGDRLLLYTDGAEEAMGIASGSTPEHRLGVARSWRGVPRDELLLQLTARFDVKRSSSAAEDDVTVMVVDVEK